MSKRSNKPTQNQQDKLVAKIMDIDLGPSAEEVQAGLLQWILETQRQIEMVARELDGGQLHWAVASAADSIGKELESAAQALLGAADMAVSIVAPNFLSDMQSRRAKGQSQLARLKRG